MALRASILERVTGEATALVQHREVGVSAALEECQRLMTARSLVMTTHASVGNVTSGAFVAVKRGEFAVHIVAPANGVRGRAHGPVALFAALFGG